MEPTQQQLANRMNPTAYSVSLPQEGQVFRGVGDDGSVFKVVNGQLTRIGGNQITANTDLMYNGQLYKAGSQLPQGADAYGGKNISQANPRSGFSGTWWSNKSAADQYPGFSSLPQFNIADIQSQTDPNTGMIKGLGSNQTLNNTPNSLAPGVPSGSQPAQVGNQPNQNNDSGVPNPNGQGNLPIYNPNASFQTGSGGTSGGSSTGSSSAVASDLSGLPPEFQDLYKQLDAYLQKLQSNGQVLNPNITIDPTQTAAFLTQAHNEIDPYYSSQLKLATDTLSKSIGYAQGTEANTENNAGTTYARDLRTLQGNEADKGFAQSGERNTAEGDLATNTQNTINDARRTLAYNAGNAASTYAQKYGSGSLPSFTTGPAPRVIAGESKFDTTGPSSSLYSLSPDVYSGLKGSEQFQQSADVANRASQLEGAFRSNQGINQARALTL